MARILVVDDEAVNRALISAFLAGEGHALIEADSGERALEIAKQDPPDLVLLDVMMPGLNGFETARMLREQCRETFIPIILLTSLNDQSSKVLGLKVGADDVLSKPVDRAELLVRIHHLLSLRDKELALLQRNTEHAELHRFKDELSQMIVHDLKNPLTAVIANLDFVLQNAAAFDLTQAAALDDAQSAARRTVRLIHNLLDIARLEAKRFELRRARMSLERFIAPIVTPRMVLAEAREIELKRHFERPVEVVFDAEIMTRVVENVLDNALRFTPAGGQIHVIGDRLEECARIRIGNTGPTIPPESRAVIFEKYGQASANSGRKNLGLGLYFCRLATEAHGGRMWVEELDSLPTVFGIELPLE